jgi:soluble lytic murein transglycosylase-like protein
MAAVFAAGVDAFAQQAPPAGAAIDSAVMFRAAARLYDLDPELLAAIAHVESGGDADAVSPKGAQGLMQLMPSTANRFGVKNPLDPIDNTLGAARFLDYLKRWQTRRRATGINLPELIAAYNAGEGAVDKYDGIPPYPETRQYVRKVLLTYLLSDTRATESRLRIRPAVNAPRRVLIGKTDALEQLDEIRRQRAIALGRQLRRVAVSQ